MPIIKVGSEIPISDTVRNTRKRDVVDSRQDAAPRRKFDAQAIDF